MEKTNFKDKVALVWDNGLFIHVATKLSESFGRVLYGTPSINAFPTSNLTLPGDGIPGIERIIDLYAHVDEADLIVFPDVMFGEDQVYLEKQGKKVFGARRGESLELNRWKTKKLLRKLGMPVAESHLIIGMPMLHKFLETHEGKWWIKTSRYRGDFETFESENYEDVIPKLDELQHKLGIKSDIYHFIVERDIPAIVEVGYDGFSVNGEFPKTGIIGCEIKDMGYIGVFTKYDEMPEQIKWVNEKTSSTMRDYRYAGFYSNEIRCQELEEALQDWPDVKEDQFTICTPDNELVTVPGTTQLSFLTDPTCRAPSPPSEVYIEWMSNWPEMIWEAAHGNCIDMEAIDRWGAEIMLHSGWADKGWQPVRYPKEMEQFIKLRNRTRINGIDYAVPQGYGLPEIGAVVATGSTLEEAIELCKERAEAVKGYFIEAKVDAIPKAVAAIEKAQANGINFTDEPLPDDSTLVEIAKGEA